MKRNRINSNLIYTTSDSETKQSFCSKNRNLNKRKIYFMTVFGTQKRISHDQYLELKKAGLNVIEKEIEQ